MQLQIECNDAPFQKQLCLTCDRQFETTEAKVIVCNDLGKAYGEVCPHCLEKGFNWISDRFSQLNQPKRKVALRQARNLKLPVSA
jgi:predicted amidophosphoribosyltransferase